MKRWKILQNKPISTNAEIIELLLSNRKILKKDREEFLDPRTDNITLEKTGLSRAEFNRFKKILENAFANEEKIIVYGDYDVDGITGSAILFETLYARTKNVSAYIPSRADEGYGLSIKGIDNVLEKNPDTKLIITVDNGIVANKAVLYAKEKGIGVVITDHHAKGEKEPDALCILHTTSLCGAGVAWVIARELGFENEDKVHEKLGLAALATVADLVPLIGANRAIVKEGLEVLRETRRLGLRELFNIARIDKKQMSVYTIGHQIAPRLNASGRLAHAIQALRLLCTNNEEKARKYAKLLNDTNQDRQLLTDDSVQHAKLLALEHKLNTKIILVSHESYNQGIIGLVASHLVESYYRPSFAISIGIDGISKGSARSIPGVNIIDMLRAVSDELLEVGGHPMAAGFSVRTEKINSLHASLSKEAERLVTEDLLEKILYIDMMIPFSLISKSLYHDIQALSPFGMANFEPIFATENVRVEEVRRIGREGNHLKFILSNDRKSFEAVAFGGADKYVVSNDDIINIAYAIDQNVWNGKIITQLKIKDLKTKDVC